MPKKPEESTQNEPVVAKETVKVIEPVFIRDLKDIPSFYINNASVRTTMFDVRMTLGQAVDTEGNKVFIDPQVVVSTSPAHAKSLVRILQKQIEHYEKEYGPLPTG
ncbi:MAG TPA: DUF3467 domain-containing protein [Gammaproteobacteria bacterium]|nr:DUF3467 domain-containing protein [Gammaproteobacteria bacterium]